MTICIATIGTCSEFDNKEAIIFATDHMITLENIGQFEHSIEKYRKINETTIAMLSGQALLFKDILKEVDTKKSLEKIKDTIQKNMKNIRDKRLKNVIFDKFKIDFDYLKTLLPVPQHNDLICEILDIIKKFDLKTSIILLGFVNNKAQIIEINETQAINTRDINFDAIGSGGIQAINTLLFQRHSKSNSLETTIYNTYKAKRNAEVSVGVGKETDLLVLVSDGTLYRIGEKQINILKDIYTNEMKFGKENKQLKEIVENLEVIQDV